MLHAVDIFITIYNPDFLAYLLPKNKFLSTINFALNAIDYNRVFEVMQQTGYTGWICIEYDWIDWQHCNDNECDNLSETILFRNFFREMV